MVTELRENRRRPPSAAPRNSYPTSYHSSVPTVASHMPALASVAHRLLVQPWRRKRKLASVRLSLPLSLKRRIPSRVALCGRRGRGGKGRKLPRPPLPPTDGLTEWMTAFPVRRHGGIGFDVAVIYTECFWPSFLAVAATPCTPCGGRKVHDDRQTARHSRWINRSLAVFFRSRRLFHGRLRFIE